jgi:hypothetical protein
MFGDKLINANKKILIKRGNIFEEKTGFTIGYFVWPKYSFDGLWRTGRN